MVARYWNSARSPMMPTKPTAHSARSVMGSSVSTAATPDPPGPAVPDGTTRSMTNFSGQGSSSRISVALTSAVVAPASTARCGRR